MLRARALTAQATTRAALLTGLVFALPVLLGRRYLGLDLTFMDLGLACELRQRWGSADGLALSPWLGNGGPLLADAQSQWLYPVRWLTMILPVDLGLSVGVVLHLALAAAGAAWLARTLGARSLVASAVGVAYACSGITLSQVVHSTYLTGAAWMPVLWAGGRRLLQRPRGRAGWLGVLAGVLGCVWGADPQALGMGLGLLLLEAARAWRRRGPSVLHRAAWGAAAVACGLLASALPWLTTLAETALTSRASGFQRAAALSWPFSPAEWPSLLAQGFLHAAVQGGSPWTLLSTGETIPWNESAYVGPLFLALVVAGAGHPAARVALVALLGGVVLAVGDALPVYGWLWDVLPPLRLFRYPAKYLVVANLAAAAVMAVASSALLRHPQGRRRVALAAGTVALGVGVLVVAAPALDALVLDGNLVDETLPTLGDVLVRALLPGWVLALAGAALVMRRAHVLPWLVAADLVVAAAGTLHVGPAAEPLHSPLVGLRQGTPEVVLCHDPVLSKREFGGAEGRGPWGQVAFFRFVGLPTGNACDGLASGVSYSLLQSSANALLARELTQGSGAAARALGCTHLVTEAPASGGVTRVDLPRWPPAVGVYAVQDPVPRVFTAPAPRLQDGELAAVQEVLRASRAAEVLNVVDDPLRRLPEGTVLPAAGDVRLGQVDWMVQSAARVALEGTGGAVVGLRTSFQVGWQARQGERELPVVRVAGSHVAAVVEDVARGPVEFRYRPPRLGAAVGACLLGLVGALLLWRRRDR